MKVGHKLQIIIDRTDEDWYHYEIVKNGDTIEFDTRTAKMTIAQVMQKVCQEVVG